jgi:hypothetical protein
MKRPEDDPLRYYLRTEQRHAVWRNEVALFVVIMVPVLVTAFWYGATIEVFDSLGQVTAGPLISRGIGLAAFLLLCAGVGTATLHFAQPSAERVASAQPVRGLRRLSYAGFDGLLVGLVTSQSLADGLERAVISIGLGVAAALVTYLAMRAMVDIPPDWEREQPTYPQDWWVSL